MTAVEQRALALAVVATGACLGPAHMRAFLALDAGVATLEERMLILLWLAARTGAGRPEAA